MCPLIELLHTYPESALQCLSHQDQLRRSRFSDLVDCVQSGAATYQSIDRNIEFSSLSLFSNENTVWAALAIAIKQAAIRAGFSDDYSGKFAGAIAELHDNIVEHSEHAGSGYVVFDATPGRFDFVVADKGIGVVEALRNNPVYSDISDAGLALEKALTHGVSGTGIPGKGTGFKPTIEGLANIAHSMRFRTGDHSREFIRDDSGGITARTSQKVSIGGFFVAVSCDASMV